jgi:hypothetical protein
MRTLALLGLVVAVVLMVILVAVGAHQFTSVLVPLLLLPALIALGGRRRMARRPPSK